MAGSGDALGSAWSPVTPRHFCVAGVALGDIHVRFVWRAKRSTFYSCMEDALQGQDRVKNHCSFQVRRTSKRRKKNMAHVVAGKVKE